MAMPVLLLSAASLPCTLPGAAVIRTQVHPASTSPLILNKCVNPPKQLGHQRAHRRPRHRRANAVALIPGACTVPFPVPMRIPAPVQALPQQFRRSTLEFPCAFRPCPVDQHARTPRPKRMEVPARPRLRVNPRTVAPIDSNGSSSVSPWMEAARNFEMNTDFDLSNLLNGQITNLEDLWTIMRNKSEDRWTVQAMSDKVTLHQMVQHLAVPQLPILKLLRSRNASEESVEQIYRVHLADARSAGLIVKPSHLCNSAGIIKLWKPKPGEWQGAIQHITAHIMRFINEKPPPLESAAMQSLQPGIIVQPQYDPACGYPDAIEVRVAVLWGKARLAIWWFGRKQHRLMNVWWMRRLAHVGRISDDDAWEAFHRQTTPPLRFVKALDCIQRHVKAMVGFGETVATALGAPYLRADFFVGSTQWGLRLNEVAYTSSIDYFNRSDGTNMIVDDAPAICRILTEGQAQCKTRLPPAYFLGKMGVSGHGYHDMAVVQVDSPQRVGTIEQPPQTHGPCTKSTRASSAHSTISLSKEANEADGRAFSPGRTALRGRERSQQHQQHRLLEGAALVPIAAAEATNEQSTTTRCASRGRAVEKSPMQLAKRVIFPEPTPVRPLVKLARADSAVLAPTVTLQHTTLVGTSVCQVCPTTGKINTAPYYIVDPIQYDRSVSPCFDVRHQRQSLTNQTISLRKKDVERPLPYRTIDPVQIDRSMSPPNVLGQITSAHQNTCCDVEWIGNAWVMTPMPRIVSAREALANSPSKAKEAED